MSLIGDASAIGIDAFRLNPDEGRAWRALRSEIGDVPANAVAVCWRRHGSVKVRSSLPEAVEAFFLGKTREGISSAGLSHFRPLLEGFRAAL